MNFPHTTRPAVTYIEIFVTISIVAVCIGAVLILLTSTTQQRVRQGGQALVEQEAVRILTNITRRMRNAESATPELGGGVELLLSDPNISPMTICLEDEELRAYPGSGVCLNDATGNVVRITRNTRIRVTAFTVAAQSDPRSFTLSMTLVVPWEGSVQTAPQPQTFSAAVTLHPDDVATPDP